MTFVIKTKLRSLFVIPLWCWMVAVIFGGQFLVLTIFHRNLDQLDRHAQKPQQQHQHVLTEANAKEQLVRVVEKQNELKASAALRQQQQQRHQQQQQQQQQQHEVKAAIVPVPPKVSSAASEAHAAPRPVRKTPLDWKTKEASLEYVHNFASPLKERPLAFLHIPKTAGTAIEYAAGAANQNLAWGSCAFYHKPKRDICPYPKTALWPEHVGWWHLPAWFFPLARINPYYNHELFGVIRDPYDRMVSEFYYTCTLRVLEWRPDQCERDKLFDRNYMNRWLQAKFTKRNEENDSALVYIADNGHFTPQFEFVVGPFEVRMLDHVLTLQESLNDEFRKLVKAFGYDKVKLRKINAIGAAERDQETHLGVQDLSEDTVNHIHDMYARDFVFAFPKNNNNNK